MRCRAWGPTMRTRKPRWLDTLDHLDQFRDGHRWRWRHRQRYRRCSTSAPTSGSTIDGPTVTAISDLTGANDGLPIAGTYNFSVGADDVDNSPTDGIVLNRPDRNDRPAAGRSPMRPSRTLPRMRTTVTYNFSFNYYPGPTSTTTQAASGTVVFNKTDGTFTFDLNQLIGGQTTFSTSCAAGFLQLRHRGQQLAGDRGPAVQQRLLRRAVRQFRQAAERH